MRLDDLRETSNVDDRRGLSGGHIALGGGGGLCLVVIGRIAGHDMHFMSRFQSSVFSLPVSVFVFRFHDGGA